MPVPVLVLVPVPERYIKNYSDITDRVFHTK